MQKYKKTISDGFTEFERKNDFSSFDDDQVSEEKTTVSPVPYKLHISISREDYAKYKKEIKNILLPYLDNTTINSFKMTQDDFLQREVTRYHQVIELTNRYEELLDNQEPIDKEFKEKYLNCLSDFYYRPSLPNKHAIPDIINQFILPLRTAQRLVNGDQFTLYLPNLYCKEQILKLCNEIDVFLTEKNIVHGKRIDVELPLGRYINFRQEYLIEDYQYHYLNQESWKIDAIELQSNEDSQLERRKKVIEEEKNSELYLYLSQYLLSSCNEPDNGLIPYKKSTEISENLDDEKKERNSDDNKSSEDEKNDDITNSQKIKKVTDKKQILINFIISINSFSNLEKSNEYREYINWAKINIINTSNSITYPALLQKLNLDPYFDYHLNTELNFYYVTHKNSKSEFELKVRESFRKIEKNFFNDVSRLEKNKIIFYIIKK